MPLPRWKFGVMGVATTSSLLSPMAAATMATGSSAPLRISLPSCSHGKLPAAIPPSRPASYPRTQKFYPSLPTPRLGLGSLAPWSGLKQLGISRQRRIKENKLKCQGRVVHASLFGVGAPEALVIGVVALLVFGPKGLAEVARNLGKTLRAFQPTIRELQEVSREFKSTLEREIGLDEVESSVNNTYKSGSSLANENPQSVLDPNGTPPTTQPYSSEELLKRTEEQLASSATTAQAQATSSKEQPEVSAENVAATNISEIATQKPISEKTRNET